MLKQGDTSGRRFSRDAGDGSPRAGNGKGPGGRTTGRPAAKRRAAARKAEADSPFAKLRDLDPGK